MHLWVQDVGQSQCIGGRRLWPRPTAGKSPISSIEAAISSSQILALWIVGITWLVLSESPTSMELRPVSTTMTVFRMLGGTCISGHTSTSSSCPKPCDIHGAIPSGCSVACLLFLLLRTFCDTRGKAVKHWDGSCGCDSEAVQISGREKTVAVKSTAWCLKRASRGGTVSARTSQTWN